MSDKYPTKELIKMLPYQWPESFVGAGDVDENNIHSVGAAAKDAIDRMRRQKEVMPMQKG